MSKNHKRSKRLKSEKSKVKLKAKKSTNQLPKGLNITDTSFKVKKILIREQLKQRNETELLSTRKLNIDDLLTRFRHHNPSVREGALSQLKDILSRNPPKSLHSRLNSLLRGIAALSLDKERDVRRSSFHALDFILGSISNEQLIPLREIVISYLSCAMTHIDPRVKQDSLLFLDVLVRNCDGVLARDSHKILPNFLNMICRLHNEVRPGARLTTTLNSTSTDVRWKNKVLERLANMLVSVVNCRKLATTRSNVLPIARAKRYVPVYSNDATRAHEISLEDVSSMGSCVEETLSMQEFMKYVGLLMPLISDIWLEVCPDEKVDSYTELTISSEATALLKNIVVIVRSIVEYIDTFDRDDCNVDRMRHWFKDTFHEAYMKNFLSRFPYTEVKLLVNEYRKRQRDFSQIDFTDGCLEQNLGLCQIHVWFTSLFGRNEQFPKSTKTHCLSIVKYLNGVIENWCDSAALSQLIELLRTLFLKAAPVWYTNRISLSHTLQLLIEASSRLSKKELQSHLYLTIGDIMLKSDLNELHREKTFESFVTILPSLLLRPSIDDVVIRMINQIVLRFKEWIRKELIASHESIIENAKKMEIVGSHNDKQSRLMICNLFYFIDSQIYY
ncbi:PREDICTED: testis-expressed sequence 10 protein homolog [Vollenhovia emeryi]|uniref:testis-expressed sequence 10 protein homolog n=1 Tax=Vollenhovia emeryi TaxID=411798 RepID=UPI0005F579B4|nr:PREDICTED: testis-expressed sequence 10 protein homolog [Vollenhovia emeryi]XP_011865399.1 PREDICTED: testis-expressed sequence 10 protein homolog [Vollenhovia emeryi]